MLCYVSLLLETRPLSVLTRGLEWSKLGCCGIKLSLVGEITSLVLLKLHTQRRPIYFKVICNFLSSGLHLNCILSFLFHFLLLGKQSRFFFIPIKHVRVDCINKDTFLQQSSCNVFSSNPWKYGGHILIQICM